jgi:hypothetical protein
MEEFLNKYLRIFQFLIDYVNTFAYNIQEYKHNMHRLQSRM